MLYNETVPLQLYTQAQFYMKNSNYFISLVLILSSFLNYSQQKQEKIKYKVEGKVFEKSVNAPLEYATLTFVNIQNPKSVFGGITNPKGEFTIEVSEGTYDIKIEFISFKPKEIKAKTISSNTILGLIELEEDATQLNEVQVRAEKTTIEIKLDKKVYNVGKDIMVKGGTVSDVLDNVPSVAVDVEGNVSLRGNENVKILIDGRPSNVNVTEALRLISADAIDKVEVITNPSARYDAEGGGGLINIILKKGKNQGVNGTLITNAGYPDNQGFSGTLNYKTKEFNLFTTQGYSYRSSPGNAIFNSRYLNDDNTTKDYLFEDRDNDRLSKSYNANFGVEWFLDNSTTWTNAFNYRKSNGDNTDNVNQDYYDENLNFNFARKRINKEISTSSNVEFTTNFIKKFKKEGHKLTIDGSFSTNSDLNTAIINETQSNSSALRLDETLSDQKQSRNLIQTDYVLPVGKGSQFELGYRGDFTNITTKFSVDRNGIPYDQFTNTLEYIEKVNALYSQFGFKIKNFSTLLGMRWEDSNININQLATNDYNNKRYNNFFPSAFFNYEFKDKSSATLSYSKRIQRPRGRQLNPFNNLSSNVNIFVGNPDLDPAYTDAIDLGYIKRWDKLTFSTSLYFNITKDFFERVRIESGEFDNGVPIIITQPINLATEYRTGFEFTLNYSPYKWWKLNGNFNIFQNRTDGDFTYTDFIGNEVYQNFDFTNTSWFTRITSKITLPYKIDWQTNATYNGEQKNAQGKTRGIFGVNLGFSKDVLKDKGTIAFNVSDVFNSRIRIMENYIPGGADTYAEMQWRVRQFTVSFTYRFNVQKNEKEKPKKSQQDDGGGDF